MQSARPSPKCPPRASYLGLVMHFLCFGHLHSAALVPASQVPQLLLFYVATCGHPQLQHCHGLCQPAHSTLSTKPTPKPRVNGLGPTLVPRSRPQPSGDMAVMATGYCFFVRTSRLIHSACQGNQ